MNSEVPEIIIPPRSLRSKVEVGGFNAVNDEAIRRAEEVVENMSDTYLEWVEADLNKIQELYDQLVSDTVDEMRDVYLDKIFKVAHDIKGQGGSFGFDLVTSIGNHLCRLIELFDDQNVKESTQNEAIKIHVDSMRLVISDKMKGDGGSSGEAILTGIEMMVRKLIPAN